MWPVGRLSLEGRPSSLGVTWSNASLPVTSYNEVLSVRRRGARGLRCAQSPSNASSTSSGSGSSKSSGTTNSPFASPIGRFVTGRISAAGGFSGGSVSVGFTRLNRTRWWSRSAAHDVAHFRDLRRAGVDPDPLQDRPERLPELLERLLRLPYVEDA